MQVSFEILQLILSQSKLVICYIDYILIVILIIEIFALFKWFCRIDILQKNLRPVSSKNKYIYRLVN